MILFYIKKSFETEATFFIGSLNNHEITQYFFYMRTLLYW